MHGYGMVAIFACLSHLLSIVLLIRDYTVYSHTPRKTESVLIYFSYIIYIIILKCV